MKIFSRQRFDPRRPDKIRGCPLSRLVWNEDISVWFCRIHQHEFLIFAHGGAGVRACCRACERDAALCLVEAAA